MNNVLRYLRNLVAIEDSRRLDDRELLSRFVERRSESAFAAIVERHGPMVFAAARRVLRCEQDAEDVLQATFLVLARKATAIRRGESVRAWLYGTAYRLALKVRGKVNRREAVEKNARTGKVASPLDRLTVAELGPILDEELARLPEKYRLVILHCCLDGKSRDEAARELGWKEGAVKICLERGRALLRKNLARRGIALSSVLITAHLASVGASAALPVRVTVTTVDAALKFAAGESVSGFVSAAVPALANQALRGFAVAKVKLACAGILLCGSLGLGVAWHGSQELAAEMPMAGPIHVPNVAAKPVPNPASSEASETGETVALEKPKVGATFAAILRGVDHEKATVTLRNEEQNTNYVLQAACQVLIDGKPAVARDLKAGWRVEAELADDGKAIRALHAKGPLVKAKVHALNADTGTITLLLGDAGKTQTFTLANAKSLASLTVDSSGEFQLSVDRAKVLGVSIPSH